MINKNNENVVKIVDMQGKETECILSKRDLQWIFHGLSQIDVKGYTANSQKEIEALMRYFRKFK